MRAMNEADATVSFEAKFHSMNGILASQQASCQQLDARQIITSRHNAPRQAPSGS